MEVDARGEFRFAIRFPRAVETEEAAGSETCGATLGEIKGGLRARISAEENGKRS